MTTKTTKTLDFVMLGLLREAVPLSVLRRYKRVEAALSPKDKPNHPPVEVYIRGRDFKEFIVCDKASDNVLMAFPFPPSPLPQEQQQANAKACAYADSLGRIWEDFGGIDIFDPKARRWWCTRVKNGELPIDWDEAGEKYGLLP